MDYAIVRAAIDGGTAAAVIPPLALAAMREIASGNREMSAIRHPLGFLCFPVRRDGEHGVCVHLWTADVKQSLTTSAIHAHSWDLTSYVLYGSLRNVRNRISEDRGSPTHRIFEVRSLNETDELSATDRLVSCQPDSDIGYCAGSTYLLPAGEFHATVAPDGEDVATVALSQSHTEGADLALGPADMPSHTVTRERCDPAESARIAGLIAERLAAAG